MQDTRQHRPPRTDHIHEPIPIETAFDFLNTLELEDGALVERLTLLDAAGRRIAEPVVREVGGGHDRRFRICANDTCRWIFYDESRSGQRRWCDMATCGNRAKARRHRERQKEQEIERIPAPAATPASGASDLGA